MELFTKKILEQLKENGRKQNPVKGTEKEIDFKPVVKIFTGQLGFLPKLAPMNQILPSGFAT